MPVSQILRRGTHEAKRIFWRHKADFIIFAFAELLVILFSSRAKLYTPFIQRLDFT